jgi:hypothetical protein
LAALAVSGIEDGSGASLAALGRAVSGTVIGCCAFGALRDGPTGSSAGADDEAIPRPFGLTLLRFERGKSGLIGGMVGRPPKLRGHC